jgi:alpha-glucosidase (family GH31 glycosyl hydrolase)
METVPGWEELAPGVWSRTFRAAGEAHPVGRFVPMSPAEAAGAPWFPARGGIPPDRRGPLPEALGRLPRPSFPLDPAAVTAERVAGRLVVRLPLPPAAPVYGLGLQFFRLNQRGRTRYLRVNSDPRQDTGETHAPVPFYVVDGRGAEPPLPSYGVLVHTARIVTLHCGSTVRREPGRPPAPTRDRTTDPRWQATPPSDWVEAVVAGEAERLEVGILVFGGPDPLTAVRRYNLFFGGGALPPRWALGFWHRTPARYRDAEVLEEAREYRRRGYPCDVVGLEPGWHSAAYPCTYRWSPERFPDPGRLLAQLAAEGFRVNLWEHPWVAPGADLYPRLEPLSGSHTVWGGLAPDYTLPAARAALAQQHEREHLDLGVAGYKLDECDGSELTAHSWMFPAHATFPSGHDGEEMRQLYGLLLQRLTAELFWRRGRRTWGLVRASGAAAPALPYVLYTDLYDHRQYVRAMVNAGFCGLLFAPEVRGARDAEEWVRRLQVACLSPLAMLNAWASGTKPWSFPEAEGAVRAALELRMRLLPYLYTAFARYCLEGVPPVRAMALLPEERLPADPALAARLRAADDQFLLGDDLLVAPLFAGQRERTVLLPEGTWYGLESGEAFPGGREVTVAGDLDTLPVFVLEGAILPLCPPLPHTPQAGQALPLEVRHYGRLPGRLLLYDDDGETLAYARGAYRWLELGVDVGPDGRRTGYAAPEAAEPGPGLAYRPISWRMLG